MMQAVEFDENTAAIEAIVSSPDVSPGQFQQASTGAEQVAQPVDVLPQIVPDNVAQRHGRFVSKMIGNVIKEGRGKALDDDTRDTMAEGVGELFSIMSRCFGSRSLYFGLLGGMTVGLMGLMAWRATNESEGEKNV